MAFGWSCIFAVVTAGVHPYLFCHAYLPPALLRCLSLCDASRIRLSAFAFGAHCSNSLHAFSNNDKYVTSYFCIFFLRVLLGWVSLFLGSPDLCAAGGSCFFSPGFDAALLAATFVLFRADAELLFVPVARLPGPVWLALEEVAAWLCSRVPGARCTGSVTRILCPAATVVPVT